MAHGADAQVIGAGARPQAIAKKGGTDMIRWFPWRYLISRLARSHGFIDPLLVLARLRRFAQPSEVTEPIELLRAGLVFHARGLINTRSIQHNLNWVWPYWIERQFDPTDVAFVPRAFSITHVNLTHRNWTAIGLPDLDWLPIVDPRGLLTPVYDRWSIDSWVIPDEGTPLLPSRAPAAVQTLRIEPVPTVETAVADDRTSLRQQAWVELEDGEPVCRLRVEVQAAVPGWLAVSLRPANPEGVSLVHRIARSQNGYGLRIDGVDAVRFDRVPQRVSMSYYRRGDVYQRLPDAETDSLHCEVGLATAAALFRLAPGAAQAVQVSVPLRAVRHLEPHLDTVPDMASRPDWDGALAGTCQLEIPDARMQFLYAAALRTLVLHAPGPVYPGPYTYKRFWFRDAAFILDALLAAGLHARVRRALDGFSARQTALGYFHSQEGEWDSNGEAMWIIERYRRCSGEPLSSELVHAVEKGVRWIRHKRLSDDLPVAHAGLLPAGFSAEHLGPNDFYYWDDFWSAAGLQAAAASLGAAGRVSAADAAAREARDLLAAVDRSLAARADQRVWVGVPASPYRDMDSGAIGSLAASYPLQVWPAREPRLAETVNFLLERCTVDGGFFQDMIHSGVNAYMTLHIAQVLLRAEDPRHLALIERVAELASPTGQWPEAIHPHTGGGCMGDGQHVWAAAEWVLMLRNCFVREERETLVLGQGIPRQWLNPGQVLRLGPTATRHGPVRVELRRHREAVQVRWEGHWHADRAPRIEVRLPGAQPVAPDAHAGSVEVSLPPPRLRSTASP